METSRVNELLKPALTPIAICRERADFFRYWNSDERQTILNVESDLVAAHAFHDQYLLPGYCLPCTKSNSFLIDKNWGSQETARAWIPNWRERLVCPDCQLNNRQRVVASLLKQELDAFNTPNAKVYLMEQVTPIYKWCIQRFPEHEIIGSEYLGHDYIGGSTIEGLRHEDVQHLSFIDGFFDLIVSNDVFEHIPDPKRALVECRRVLKSGGELIMTIPFDPNAEKSYSRATFEAGALRHIHPPVYHGNPISEVGSLVFTDFGWDILATLRASGFKDAVVEIYHSTHFGHLGSGQLVFRALTD